MQLPLKKKERKETVKKWFELPDYQCTFDFPFVPSSGQQHLKVIPWFVFWLCIVVFWKCYFNYLCLTCCSDLLHCLIFPRWMSKGVLEVFQEVVSWSHRITCHLQQLLHITASVLFLSNQKDLLLWGRTLKWERPQEILRQPCYKLNTQERVVLWMIPVMNPELRMRL